MQLENTTNLSLTIFAMVVEFCKMAIFVQSQFHEQYRQTWDELIVFTWKIILK